MRYQAIFSPFKMKISSSCKIRDSSTVCEFHFVTVFAIFSSLILFFRVSRQQNEQRKFMHHHHSLSSIVECSGVRGEWVTIGLGKRNCTNEVALFRVTSMIRCHATVLWIFKINKTLIINRSPTIMPTARVDDNNHPEKKKPSRNPSRTVMFYVFEESRWLISLEFPHVHQYDASLIY